VNERKPSLTFERCDSNLCIGQILDAARTQYTPGLDLDLDPPRTAWDLTSQQALPFAEFQRLSLVGEGRS